MSWQIKLHPGSTPNIVDFKFWIDLELNPSSSELWIDFSQILHDGSNINWQSVESSERVVVYDIFHASPLLNTSWVQMIADKKPTAWLTTNPVPIPGLKTIHFDYYWNRCRKAYLENITLHKLWGNQNHQLYPIHTRPRQKKFLTYHFSVNEHRRWLHDHLVARYDGFYNDPLVNCWLQPNESVLGGQPWDPGRVAPPARYYYDESYVTCLVESQYLGTNFTISEKTYDHLIQGRAVLNFAPAGFYQFLDNQGWALPQGIDWSWNQIADDSVRFDRYLEQIDRVLGQSQEQLHQWFLNNISCWQHNQKMLEIKPYDIVNTKSIW